MSTDKFYHLTSDFFEECKLYPIWIYFYEKKEYKSHSVCLLVNESEFQLVKKYMDSKQEDNYSCDITGVRLTPFTTSQKVNPFWLEKPYIKNMKLHQNDLDKKFEIYDCKDNLKLMNGLTRQGRRNGWIYAYKYLSKYFLKLNGVIQSFVHDYGGKFRLAHKMSGFRKIMKDKKSPEMYIVKSKSEYFEGFELDAKYWKSNTKHIRTCQEAFEMYDTDKEMKSNIYGLFKSKDLINHQLLKEISYVEK